MRIQIGLVAAACLLVMSLAACGSASDPSNQGSSNPQSPSASVSPGPESVKAQELFQKTNCISCHGVDLAGRVGPKTNLQKVGSTMTQEQIASQIRNGGGGMQAYQNKLTPEEIDLLAGWLSSKK
jgi:cytochrome c551